MYWWTETKSGMAFQMTEDEWEKARWSIVRLVQGTVKNVDYWINNDFKFLFNQRTGTVLVQNYRYFRPVWVSIRIFFGHCCSRFFIGQLPFLSPTNNMETWKQIVLNLSVMRNSVTDLCFFAFLLLLKVCEWRMSLLLLVYTVILILKLFAVGSKSLHCTAVLVLWSHVIFTRVAFLQTSCSYVLSFSYCVPCMHACICMKQNGKA